MKTYTLKLSETALALVREMASKVMIPLEQAELGLEIKRALADAKPDNLRAIDTHGSLET